MKSVKRIIAGFLLFGKTCAEFACRSACWTALAGSGIAGVPQIAPDVRGWPDRASPPLESLASSDFRPGDNTLAPPKTQKHFKRR
jgi:hypothetical protein